MHNLMTDEQRAKTEALSWLLEMEAIHNPIVQNSFIANILRVSHKIVDVQLVTDVHKKKLLIYLQLTWWGNRFNRKVIAEQVANIIHEVMPNLEIRVTYSLDILNKSLEVAKDL